MKKDFWIGKKVFLTGHTGFKGTWLTLWLEELGATVTGFSIDKPSTPSMFECVKGESSCKNLVGDIRDFERLALALKQSEADIVLHMAAQSLVRTSYDSPVETYSVNVMGTINVLEAIRLTPSVRAAVVITTDKCYENKEWVWGYRENDPMGGHDPYSSSKACAEIVTSSWRRSYLADTGVQVASARAGNVIGGGDWAKDRIIPDLVRALNSGESPLIRNPYATRPWQHVLEPLSGYLTLAEALWNRETHAPEAWNFGPSDESIKPVNWIADRVCQLYGDKKWKLEGEMKKPHEANLLALDCSKAHHILKWEPKWDICKALTHTVDWYRAFHLEPLKIRDFTISQIKNYTSSQEI